MTEFRPTRFEVLPLVIKNLLIINVLVFLAQNTFPKTGLINMENLFALHHVKSSLFQPWQLVTYLFLHGNFMHLLGNMFALWMFGAILESVWGPRRFLTFYFLCGIGAGLIQLAFLWYDYQPLLNQFFYLKQHVTPQGIINYYGQVGGGNSSQAIFQKYADDPSNTANINAVLQDISDITDRVISNPTLGASGAIFGILAAFVYLFPNTYLYFYFLVPIKAKWAGLAYFVYEIYSGIRNTGDNIGHWAHVGGGLVGFLLVLTWNRKNRRNFY